MDNDERNEIERLREENAILKGLLKEARDTFALTSGDDLGQDALDRYKEWCLECDDVLFPIPNPAPTPDFYRKND